MPTRSQPRRMTAGYAPALLAAFILLAGSTQAQAQARPVDLAAATIEDLMNIEITSASRKEQRLADVPAAISVITADDIQRSGLTTVPELLRLVPGVQVAQINSSKWAVAVRGFNNLFADKLLVLVDGRTVYDRLNSGVFWESIDIPLESDRAHRGAARARRRYLGRKRGQRRHQHHHQVGRRHGGGGGHARRRNAGRRPGVRPVWRNARRGGVPAVVAVGRTRRVATRREHRRQRPVWTARCTAFAWTGRATRTPPW